MGNSIIAACKNGDSSLEELDSYFPVRPECQADVPYTRFRPRAGRTLSERRWKAAFSQEGYLDIVGVLRRIQRGGIHPSIKGAVWEFLLGCFDPNSTFVERNELRQQQRREVEASFRCPFNRKTFTNHSHPHSVASSLLTLLDGQ